MVADSAVTVLDPSDRWSTAVARVHLSGVQATVRFLVDVLRADRTDGLRTAAFVAGYPGSPLAGFDRELRSALATHLDVEIVHRPAVNEELAATAVMGSQIATTMESVTRDGILGVWYGKAPGLDRAADALRHANFAGASRRGGAIALVGDDPGAKSSTLPSASEGLLADLAMPCLFPRTLEDVLELGRHSVALSRWSGSWVAMKLVTTVADAEGTVAVAPWHAPVLPEGYATPPVSRDLLTPSTLEREPTVSTHRLAAAARYGDANGLNRLTVRPDHPRIAIVASGTTYSVVCDALQLLGLGHDALARLGVALAEVRMPFPIGEQFARELSRGVEQVVVVEERRDVLERQVLSLVARRPGSPAVLGRRDVDGRPLIPGHGSLDGPSLARLIQPLLRAALGDAVGAAPVPRRRIAVRTDAARVPWFCSGCPHSVSTVVPEGTLVGEGIGCHSIVHYMPPQRVGRSVGITQMGGEGAQWIGMAPFVDDRHIVQNMGDGTFFHSGHLAVRAAVAAGVPITFKLLWNGATAMTGGQPIEGAVRTPVDVARVLLLEGVERVVITTDDTSRYRRSRLPAGVSVRPREDVVAVQEELARSGGVTVMIHDQACATELRRARKRGLAPQPAERIVINERVCEGCGDCQVASNCLSLQTVDTPLGTKTRIDGDTCNVDRSCLKGDCPAFTLVQLPERAAHGPSRRPDRASPAGPGTAASLPQAPVPIVDRSITVRITGIGGTGVVTMAHLLAWAALIDGVDVWGLDQTGLSQKAGPVISDLRIGPGASDRSNVLEEGEVDLLLAADLLTAAVPHVLASLADTATVVGSTSATLTGPMVLGEQPRHVPSDQLAAALSEAAPCGTTTFVDAAGLAVESGAPATVANVVLLGVASQLGVLPVSGSAIEQAIERNGVAVAANLAAFTAGRRWVATGGAAAPRDAGGAVAGDDLAALPLAVRGRAQWLASDLVGYQDAALARRFVALLADVWRAEEGAGGDGRLSAAVAFGYHKLLAYKDEYEVARLLLEHPAAEGRTTWLLHPPMLRANGLQRKLRLGPWARPALQALRATRRLRGTPLDPFGRTPLRRTERQLPAEYAEAIRSLLGRLAPERLDAAVEIARLPDRVRGFESVKERNVAEYRRALSELLAAFPAG